ncbi:hypothetical protein SBA6_590015 [Candidatus Sulfopaludibacter sp. SbA6]|nr:hypothetical protein SBA6_590015 [Candidatus Sulfopaludibacter sp. SbA6]
MTNLTCVFYDATAPLWGCARPRGSPVNRRHFARSSARSAPAGVPSGSGEVYRARDTRLNRDVALKGRKSG